MIKKILVTFLLVLISAHSCVNAITCADGILCYNGGTCVDSTVGHPPVCICAPGWAGDLCDYPDNYVNTVTCADGILCENGGTCVDSTVGHPPVCICAPGWVGDLCDYPDSPDTSCPMNPCLNGAACLMAPGGFFRCACPQNYIGLLCDIRTSG